MEERSENMDFVDFMLVCRFSRPGSDGNGGFEFTCRRKDRIPPGSSWGICDEQHCPYYGVKATNAEIYVDGVKVATAKEIRYVLSD